MPQTTIQIQPLSDRIVIRTIEPDDSTPGGIILPDQAKGRPERGTVIAVGPGRMFENGVRIACSISEGDEVLFSKYGGTEIELDGETFTILTESDILARLA